MTPLSLYIHIPFCRVRCTYCAFNTYTDRFALVDDYVAALCTEMALLGGGEAVHTVYFGGGTPSLLSAEQVQTVLDSARRHFDLLPDAEITLEANPGTVSADYWRALRQTGVNRLSLGMQSAQAGELTLFERDHTLADTARALEDARAAGFDNLSLDLIYGTPGQTLADWEDSLHTALSYQPQHISMYAMELKAGTELTRLVHQGRLPTPDDDLTADMYDFASDTLARAGFEQYEISNWCLPGLPSRHNLQYWRNLPYLGLGAGAHGYVAGCRTVNVMRPELYIQRLQTREARRYPRTGATQSATQLTPADAMFETAMLGLRMLREGLSRAAFEARFGLSLDSVYGEVLERLKRQALITEEAGILRLTPAARLISNRVFEALIPESTP